jgi:methyl-accepting chemotaxis protein WspA
VFVVDSLKAQRFLLLCVRHRGPCHRRIGSNLENKEAASMNGWTIRRRILGCFAVILAMIVLMAATAAIYLSRIRADAHVIAVDSTAGALVSANILSNLLEGDGLLVRHLSLEDKADLQRSESRILSSRADLQSQMRGYEKTIFQAEDRSLFDAFKVSIAPYWAAQDRLLKMSLTQKGKDLQPFMASDVQPAFDKARSDIRAVFDGNSKHTVETIDRIDASITTAGYAIAISVFIIFTVTFAAGFLLMRAINAPLQALTGALDVMRQGDFTARMDAQRRDEFGLVADGFNRMTDELAGLVGQVQKSGLQVTTSVTEIAATSKQQQATATEIAATTAEIGATSKEISATSKQLVKTMSAVSAVAEQSAALAGAGQTGLSHMGDTMQHVMEATKAINSKLVVLNEKAGNINQVITTISKVAEQTNLLSLNAAIEAEKAGEHGRGFSVVAIEIRRLADQTAVATHDISQTVKEIQAAVSSSVMGMDKFSDQVRRGLEEVHQISDQLSQIIQHVQTLAPRVEHVNEGMQAQASGAEQITEALAQLNESAQQTVESLRQSSMAIDELNQVANGLRGGVSRFKLRA